MTEPELIRDLVDVVQLPSDEVSQIPVPTMDANNNVHVIVTFLRLILTFVFFPFIGVESTRYAIQHEETTTTTKGTSMAKEPPTDTDSVPELSLD